MMVGYIPEISWAVPVRMMLFDCLGIDNPQWYLIGTTTATVLKSAKLRQKTEDADWLRENYGLLWLTFLKMMAHNRPTIQIRAK